METGKIRNKRNRNSKPYDRGQSLIGRITRAVIPGWISKVIPWKTDESAATAGNVESESNSSDSNFKRPYSRQHTPYNIMVPEISPVPLPTTSSSTDTSHLFRLPFNKYQRENLCEIGAIDEDHEDEDSVTTSGCSSMVPNIDLQTENQTEALPIIEADLRKFPAKHSSEVGNLDDDDGQNINILPKFKDQSNVINNFESSENKTLVWSEDVNLKHSRPQQYSFGKKPSFNISAFGSPFYANKSILSESSNDSIFYPGKTTYGGAASHRSSLPSHSMNPYETNSSKRHHIKVKAKQNHEDIGLVSSTAKRILKCLEEMPTPLSDAKKIPLKSKNLTDFILSNTPASRRAKQNNKGPPVSRIMIPSRAQIQKNYSTCNRSSINTNKKLASETQVTSSSDHFTNLHTENQPTISYSASNAGGKMKSRPRESLHYSSKHVQQNTEPEEFPQLDLPEISLNIKSLPKINFGSSLGERDHSTPISTSSSEPVKGKLTADENSSDRNNSATAAVCSPLTLDFTFQSPLIKQGRPKSVKSYEMSDSQEMFQFSAPKYVSPVKINNISSGAKCFTSEVSDSATTTTALNAENGNVSKVTFKVPEAISLKRKSSMSKDSDSVGFGLQFTSASGGSSVCMTCLSNEVSDAIKCVDCQYSKPNATSDSKEMTYQPEFKYDDKFQPSKDVWECSTCLIQNKIDVLNCVACGTLKPGSDKQVSVTSDNEHQTNKLSSFMYDQNSNAKQNLGETKCVSCGSVKETSLHSDSLRQTVSHEPGGETTQKWKCAVCLVENDGDINTCTTSKSAPSLIAKSNEMLSCSTNTWECDTCLVRNDLHVTKCVACGSRWPGLQTSSEASGGYIFGNSSSSSSGTFKFGISNNNNNNGSLNRNDKIATATEPEAGFVFNANSSENKGSKSSGFGFMPSKSENDLSSTKDSFDTTEFKFAAPSSSISSSSGVTPGFVFKKSDESTSKGFTVDSSPSTSKNADNKLPSINDDMFKISSTVIPKADFFEKETKKDTIVPSECFAFGSEDLQKPNEDSVDDSKNVAPGFMFGSNPSNKVPAGGGFVFAAGPVSLTASDNNSTTSQPVSSSLSFVSNPHVSSSQPAFFGSTQSESKPEATPSGFLFGSTSTLTDTVDSSSSIVASDQLNSSNKLFQNSDSSKPVTEKQLFTAVSSNTTTTFSFPQSSSTMTMTSVAAPGLFTFGQSPSLPISSAFNVASSSVTTSISSSDIFTFGAGNMKTVSSLNTAPITTPQTFSFEKTTSAIDTKKSSGVLGTSAIPSDASFSFPPAQTPLQSAIEDKKLGFGNVASAFSAPSSTFSFGSSSVTTTSAPSGIFIFGAQSSSASSSNVPSSSTFTFSASSGPAPTFGQSQPSSFNFGSSGPSAFGANASTGSNLFGSTSASAGPATFNPISGSTTVAAPFGSTMTPSVGGNLFGANVNSAGTFGANVNSAGTFGANVNSAGTFGASGNSVGTFGASTTSTDSSSGFGFGPLTANPPAPSVFSGSGTPNFSFPPGTAPNTDFSQQSAPRFSFSATGADNPFSVPESQQFPGRRIRRPVRRNKK